jgi:hypothetical protein
MHLFAATFRTFDVAFFVFRKRKDDFKRLLAIFAVELIARHGDLQNTPEHWASNDGVRLGNAGVKAATRTHQHLAQAPSPISSQTAAGAANESAKRAVLDF